MGGRTRVKLAFIENQAARMARLKNRRKSFIKKVEELSILCGVQAFAVIYHPEEQGFVAWPTDRAEAQQVLMRYLNMPETKKSKNRLDQETYMEGVIGKMEKKLKIQLKRTNELELAYLMDEVHYGKGLQEMDINGVNSLSLLLTNKLRALREKAERLNIHTKNDAAIDALLYGK
ncbi:Agamous-like MADS-box protein AGL36 [Linum grandiflorum]